MNSSETVYLAVCSSIRSAIYPAIQQNVHLDIFLTLCSDIDSAIELAIEIQTWNLEQNV